MRLPTPTREIRALLKASADLDCSDLLVLGDEEREEKTSWYGFEGTVRFVPLWKWLLGSQ